MRIGVFFVAVLMACGALAAPATAQDADARELFRRGEAAYSVGNYDLAIREWGAAYALDPRPRIQFNLAQAYERLGRLEEASDSLKKFLDSGDPDDPMYSDANARLAALQQRLSLTGVIVKGGPDGGKIFVDDREWGRTPRPDKIPLSPGAHKVVVQWEGRSDYVANIVVPAGQVVELGIAAPPPGADGEPVTPTQEAVAPGDEGPVNDPAQAAINVDSYDDGSSPILWYALAGGAGAAGLGLLGYGIARQSALSDADCGGNVLCDDGEDSVATQRSLGIGVGAVLVVAGGAFLTVGLLSGGGDDSATLACAPGMLSAACRVKF